MFYNIYGIPNNAVISSKLSQAVMLLTCVREVLGSNMGRDTEFQARVLPTRPQKSLIMCSKELSSTAVQNKMES
jgi:hypothetical protein